jgi:hypothetical protein
VVAVIKTQHLREALIEEVGPSPELTVTVNVA